MANIDQELKDIMSAVYGRDVRQSIHDGIKAVNTSATGSALQAETSAQSALTSATNAKISEDNAKDSEDNAKDSEDKAKVSENNAKTSELNAKASETNASTSETNASTSETNAKTSEDNAKLSETKAKTSETNAKASEDNAKTSEDNAKISEDNAKDSEDNALIYKNASESARDRAELAALNAQAIAGVGNATTTNVGLVKPDGTTITVDSDGTIHGVESVPIATKTVLGKVKVDDSTVKVSDEGELSVPKATGAKVGVVKPDTTSITINANGVISIKQSILDDIESAKQGGGSTIVVTFKDDELIGKTCKITSSTLEYTQTVNSEKKAVFEVAELGTLTATCECLTKELIIYNKGNYTIAFDSFVELLVSKSGVTNTYTSVATLLENQLDTRRVMTVHASADFLVSLMTTFTTVRDTVIDSTYGLKWIGLRDYICDKLMAVSSIKTAMLESDNWEYILKDHVPVMTSNTAPYGEASASSVSISNFDVYKAFSDDLYTRWSSASSSSDTRNYIGYKFTNPICVKKIKYVTYKDSNNEDDVTFVVQGSNDGSTYTDVSDDITLTLVDKKAYYLDISNNRYYLYYRIYFKTCSTRPPAYSTYWNQLYQLQFYGRSLNVSVPTMTSNTEPYGEAFASTIFNSSFSAYLAFDKTESKTSRWASTYAESYDTRALGYKFNKDIKVNFVKLNTWVHANSKGKAIKEFKIQGSNDGSTWTDIYSGITTNKINSTTDYIDGTDMYTFSNDNTYKMYRIRPLSTWANVNVGDSYSESTINELNFYGVDYSEREYAPNSTMKYIYDHGVELENITKINTDPSGVLDFQDTRIYLKRVSQDNTTYVEFHTDAIDLTNYNVVHVNLDDETHLDKAEYYNILSALVVTSSVPWAYTSSSSATALISGSGSPYISGNISSVSGLYYIAVAGRSTPSATHTFNELWLE